MAYSSTRVFLINPPRSLSRRLYHCYCDTYDSLRIEGIWKGKRTRHKDPQGHSKTYVLSMFPYPSGSLHIGHARLYTISDTIAQYHRMMGKEVLHPIGWDSFGLPAENAAIDGGQSPSVWTDNNINIMRDQLKGFGIYFNWDKELSTSTPDYYKWTQWLFLRLYEAGLAYRKEAWVNWDPIDCTVLANEQVDDNGLSWRSGAKVERRMLNQWHLKITNYSEALLNGLDELDWPNEVKILQKNWIRRFEGVNIYFPLKDSDRYISVFTTCPEAIYGVSFIALRSDHPLVNDDITEVVHPLTGSTIPVYKDTEYVPYGYMTTTLMGVPSVDDKDKEFAALNGFSHHEVLDSENRLTNSNRFNGLTREEGAKAITQLLEAEGKGKSTVAYRWRDWLISRQRYWGTPIPILFCDNCQIVPDHNLPVLLPHSHDLSGRGLSPLLEAQDWLKTTCPKCGSVATRETDTMDTFVDSSWYFLRYINPMDTNDIINKNLASQWLPVDFYLGGIEHAVLHLLYSRFIMHFLYDIGVVPVKEPFKKLITQGLVLGKTYINKRTGEYIKGYSEEDGADNENVIVEWEKMSKSKHNGVDPLDVIKKYGIDAIRLFMLFKAPPNHGMTWESKDIGAMCRFMRRVWNITGSHINEFNERDIKGGESIDNSKVIQLSVATSKTLKLISEIFKDTHEFNIAINHLIILSSSLKKSFRRLMGTVEYHKSLLIFLKLLSPMAPYITAQLWEDLRETSIVMGIEHEGSIFDQDWPSTDLHIVNDYDLTIKVNGQIRLTMKSENFIDDEPHAYELLKEHAILYDHEEVHFVKVSHCGTSANFVLY